MSINVVTALILIACIHLCAGGPIHIAKYLPGYNLLADTDTIDKGLAFADSLSSLATNLVSNVSDHGSNIARLAINSTSSVGDDALDQGARTVHLGLDFARSASKHTPIDIPIRIGATVGEKSIDVLKKVGHRGLRMLKKGDVILAFGNHLIQVGAKEARRILHRGLTFGRTLVGHVGTVQKAVTRMNPIYFLGRLIGWTLG